MESLTSKQVQEYKDAFKLFDRDNSGSIDTSELIKVMNELGEHPTDRETKQIMEQLDSNDNGVIDFNEFLIFMRQYNTDQHERQDPEILEAFQVYDKNRDGYICPNEIIAVLGQIGVALSEEDAKEIIKEADMDGDGLINYREFAKKMNQILQ